MITTTNPSAETGEAQIMCQNTLYPTFAGITERLETLGRASLRRVLTTRTSRSTHCD